MKGTMQFSIDSNRIKMKGWTKARRIITKSFTFKPSCLWLYKPTGF